MNNFQIGDVIWYETGFHTASRARIVGITGHGATKTYVVHFMDHSQEQTNGSELNRHFHDAPEYINGGIKVSWRKCKPITYIGSEK